jgi:hypothetical protein
MTTPAYRGERGRLAEALKALRVGAGLSGARLAEMLGWQQSKVSKIETRKQLPSEDYIAAWVCAGGATPEAASDLLATLRGARVEYAAWKDAYRESGAGGVQADIPSFGASPAIGTGPVSRLQIKRSAHSWWPALIGVSARKRRPLAAGGCQG